LGSVFGGTLFSLFLSLLIFLPFFPLPFLSLSFLTSPHISFDPNPIFFIRAHDSENVKHETCHGTARHVMAHHGTSLHGMGWHVMARDGMTAPQKLGSVLCS
jgi:hypothetical protein